MDVCSRTPSTSLQRQSCMFASRTQHFENLLQPVHSQPDLKKCARHGMPVFFKSSRTAPIDTSRRTMFCNLNLLNLPLIKVVLSCLQLVVSRLESWSGCSGRSLNQNASIFPSMVRAPVHFPLLPCLVWPPKKVLSDKIKSGRFW